MIIQVVQIAAVRPKAVLPATGSQSTSVEAAVTNTAKSAVAVAQSALAAVQQVIRRLVKCTLNRK